MKISKGRYSKQRGNLEIHFNETKAGLRERGAKYLHFFRQWGVFPANGLDITYRDYSVRAHWKVLGLYGTIVRLVQNYWPRIDANEAREFCSGAFDEFLVRRNCRDFRAISAAGRASGIIQQMVADFKGFRSN